MRLIGIGLLAVAAQAAGIRGTVVENQTGHPVARSTVELEPIAGTPGRPLAARTNRLGVFDFGTVAAGSYILKAGRRGFVPVEYGQKRWNSAGQPLVLQDNDTATVTLRLPRYGAISGTVVDENEVGLPDSGVAVYRAGQPPQLMGSARSDERGAYRIGGLEPGDYLIRSVAQQQDDEEYVPTFSRDTLRAEEARLIQVYPEDETKNADVRAIPGRLYSIAGTAVTNPAGLPVRVVLVSELGRQTVDGPAFRFLNLPEGRYELFAEIPENPDLNIRAQAAYMPVPLDKDTAGVRLVLQEIRDTQFEFVPANLGDAAVVQARRKDLAGAGPVQQLQLNNGRVKLAPGPWEFRLTAPPGYYVSGFSGARVSPIPNRRADGWNEVVINFVAGLRFTLAGGAGGLRGVVQAAGAPVAGAPVFLEGYDPVNRKRVLDLRVTRTDARGSYRFADVAPGTYRMLATFEYLNPEGESMDAAGARMVEISANSEVQLDTELYILP